MRISDQCHVLTCAVLVFGLTLMTATAATPQFSVPAAYKATAIRHDLPADVLYAVALAESGKHIDVLGARRPWPWTLNIAGEGRYYPTRVAAWQALNEALARGETRIDIGLMQIHWRYHQPRLENSWLALDPHHNLSVAAEILKGCYAARRDWWASVGCYHAPNDADRASRYTQRVRKAWQSVTVNKE